MEARHCLAKLISITEMFFSRPAIHKCRGFELTLTNRTQANVSDQRLLKDCGMSLVYDSIDTGSVRSLYYAVDSNGDGVHGLIFSELVWILRGVYENVTCQLAPFDVFVAG